MSNRDTEALRHYHDTTKHSYRSIRTGGHYLDWSNYPLSFKIYSDLEPIPLPREWIESGVDALSAVSATGPRAAEATLDLRSLASILYHSAGITRRRQAAGGEIYFRAAACTGALY